MHRQPPYLTGYARKMRKDPIRAEAILWWEIRAGSLGVKFRRQVPIGPYIADFACLSHRLIVEIDGPTHDQPEVASRDLCRDDWLNAHGWKVIHTTDDEVWSDRDAVIARILVALGKDPW
jgi:very-short-patch-repair endonuclease